jgi:hypothetical protein
MNAALGHASPLGALYADVTCSTDSSGHLVCNGASATGLFAGLGVLLFVYLALAVLGIIAAVKIVTKAGFSGWWVLIAFVPIVGSIFVLVFAFSTWPVTRELEMLRRQLAGGTGYGGPAGYGGRPTPGNPGSGPLPRGPIPPGYPPPGSLPGSAPGSVPVGTVAPGAAPPDPATVTEHSLGHVPIPSFDQFIQGVTEPAMPAHQLSPVNSEPQPVHPPAGWFPAPGGSPGQMRYWDGTSWTDQYR